MVPHILCTVVFVFATMRTNLAHAFVGSPLLSMTRRVASTNKVTAEPESLILSMFLIVPGPDFTMGRIPTK